VDLAGSIISVQNKTRGLWSSRFAGAGAPSATLKLAPGDSVALKYTANAKLDDFPDGAMATLQTKDGYQTSFAVAKP